MRILCILLFFFALKAGAQEPCIAISKSKAYADQSLHYSNGLRHLDSLSAQFEAGHVASAMRGVDEVIIPVVVHVVYRDESDNISMEQIRSQMEALNRDFNWNQDDKDKIPEIWRGLGKTTGFKFKLAEVDPNGNFTSGVTRTKTSIPDIGGGDAYYRTSQGGIDPWFQPHYVNIWVCEIGDNTLGYTYLPSTSAEPNDGIVMDPRAFGMLGTATPPYDKGRTLVHEMGHYFGLRHPWGDEEGSCTNTDYMDDTPWQREANFGCPDFPSKTCASAENGDMFMNFMDYTRDTCGLLFTKNQVEFMQLVLLTSKITLTHSTAVTGLNDAAGDGFGSYYVYPNPVADVLHVELLEHADIPYSLSNLSGGLMLQGLLRHGVNSIPMAQIPNGIYLLRTELGVERVVINR